MVTGYGGAIYLPYITLNPPQTLVARVDATGTVRQYNLSNRIMPGAIFAAYGDDGGLWFDDTARLSIGRLAIDGSIKEYHLPASAGTDIFFWAAATGRDGRPWFALTNYSRSSQEIVRVHRDGTMDVFPKPPSNDSTLAMAWGFDENMWLSDGSGVSEMSQQGVLRHVAPVDPDTLTNGPDHAMWGTFPGTVYRIAANGNVRSYSIGSFFDASGITDGGDAHLWMLLYQYIDPTQPILGYSAVALGKMSQTGFLYTIPFVTNPQNILAVGPVTTDRAGNVWFTYTDTSGINVVEYTVNTC
ncbi:MAG: hypothetical protein JO165_07060 [Candidatus Eremiobacteraeota bacterium]|nr:hypothetical protein [Candidatus Eremiobacteraeota bacterium]